MNPANTTTLEIIERIEELFAVDEPNLQTRGGELALELAKRCQEMLHMKGNDDCYRSAMIHFRDKNQKARELIEYVIMAQLSRQSYERGKKWIAEAEKFLEETK